MSYSLVSVCVPCRNAGPYVGKAIESVLAQTYPRIEIIIVDDNSSDNSLEILDSYQSARVQVVTAALGSAAKSRNLALSLAQGQWIKFLDADDLLNHEAIERQLERIGERIDVVASSAWGRFYGDDISGFRLNPESVWQDLEATEWLIEAWKLAQPMTQPGMFLIPRSLIDTAGGWDETLTLNDDFEFFARILCHAKDVLFTPKAILYYRSGIAGSLSQQKTRKAYESFYHSLIKGTGYLLEKRDDPDARRSCANLLQNFIYDVFPRHLDLIKSMESRIEALGGSDLPLTAGPRLAFLARLIGWRNAMRFRALIPGY